MFYFYVNVGIIAFWFIVLLVIFQERNKLKGISGLIIFLFAYFLLQFHILGSRGVMIALVVVTSLILTVGVLLIPYSYCLVMYSKSTNCWDEKSKSV